MATSKMIVRTLLIFSTVVTLVFSYQECKCGTEWDCANLQKLVLWNNLFPCNRAQKWHLQGNKLRRFPISDAVLDYINIADNELSLGVTEFNTKLFGSLRTLNIAKNGISDLSFIHRKGAVNSCTLNTLIASHNAIADLEQIRGCYNLKEIILDNNNITSLPDGAFTGGNWYSYLLKIDLSSNPISYIAPGAFGELKALTSFHLNNTGVLSELPANIFKGFYELQELTLSGNQLRDIPEGLFTSLGKLQFLNLQRNKIENLPEEIFYTQGRLRFLDLDDNMLVEISPKVFSRLHSLEELSIRNNHLKAIPSLRDCAGPINTAVFNDNYITELEEIPIRALLQYGFQVGDLRENPISRASANWINNSSDVELSWDTSKLCGKINLLSGDTHGYIDFCVANERQKNLQIINRSSLN